MLRLWMSLSLLCAFQLVYGVAASATDSMTTPVNEVVQWNKTLLTILRTPGAQPATVHPTRSFAILHAAIYDAVSSINTTHEPYLVHVDHVSPHTSQEPLPQGRRTTYCWHSIRHFRRCSTRSSSNHWHQFPTGRIRLAAPTLAERLRRQL